MIRRAIPVVALYLIMAAAVCGLASMAACHDGRRNDTLHAALVTVNGVRDKLVAFDGEHQDQIILRAQRAGKTRAEVKAEIADYRDARAPVEAALVAVYQFIAAAATADDDLSLRAAIRSVGELSEAVTNFIKLMRGGS